MIISKTPFRVSFFGGGTDYPDWFHHNGGAVVSTTINKYCYISIRKLPPFFEHNHRIVHSKIELVEGIDEIEHPVVNDAAFAVWGWGGVALLAGRPDRSLVGVVATLALFVALCAPLCVPLFWAEGLGVSGGRGATSLALMGVTLVPAIGTGLVHAPLPKRTFDDGVMWLIVQIGALWAIVAW